MSDCCATDSVDHAPCPSCSARSGVVGALLVRAHRPAARCGDWRHCATPGCAVVFYLCDDVVGEHELVTRVGHKGTDKQTPVCYCFGRTAFSLAEDLAANCGVSTADHAVKDAVAAGECRCEQLNPSRKCCLVDMRRTLQTIRSTILLDTWPDPGTEQPLGSRMSRP